MQIVIDIDEDVYEARKRKVGNPKCMIDEVDIAIANGTPLPKGHGRLIDSRKIAVKPEYMQSIMGEVMIRVEDLSRIIADAPTIIEADKEDKEWQI